MHLLRLPSWGKGMEGGVDERRMADVDSCALWVVGHGCSLCYTVCLYTFEMFHNAKIF